jgi:hypothetical protein
LFLNKEARLRAMSVKDWAGRDGGGAVSMEVRWIHAGRLPSLLIDRLGPFREAVESREDWYLLDPGVPDLSLKLRGGAQLDVKVFRGCPGQLRLPEGSRGRLEVWEKWSFPLADDSRPWVTSRAWTRVQKARRRRSFTAARSGLVERPLAQAEAAGCALELTEVSVDDEDWWTLGLEAVGRLDQLQQDLQAVATTLGNDRLPTRFALDMPASMSYQQHLRTRGTASNRELLASDHLALWNMRSKGRRVKNQGGSSARSTPGRP